MTDPKRKAFSDALRTYRDAVYSDGKHEEHASSEASYDAREALVRLYEEAVKDGERVDFVESRSDGLALIPYIERWEVWSDNGLGDHLGNGPTLREAIDAAMSAATEQEGENG